MKKVALVAVIVALSVSSLSACKGWKGKDSSGKKDWKKSSSSYETK